MFNHILHRQQTFTYYAEYWNNTVAYNESAGTSLNEDETKLSSFWSTPFTRLCLGMKRPANGVTNWIALKYPASSLRDVIGDGSFRPTNLSVTEWKKLLNNSEIQVKSLYVKFPMQSQWRIVQLRVIPPLCSFGKKKESFINRTRFSNGRQVSGRGVRDKRICSCIYHL